MAVTKCAVLQAISALSCLRGVFVAEATEISPVKFLIVSAPGEGKVSYMIIRQGDTGGNTMLPLIETGLVNPQGIAVDEAGSKLLVVDPPARKIFSYDLSVDGDRLEAYAPYVCAEGVESHWVTVDGQRNIFYTDEASNRILKIASSKALRGNSTPEVLFGAGTDGVSTPGGIAADSFHAYWVNKQIGTQVGSLVRGSTFSPRFGGGVTPPQSLAKPSDKSYGVCMVLDNIYFTSPERSIYGVKKSGRNLEMITDKLRNPRGCAYDGDGTVYVADRGAGAVYTFAGNMQELQASRLRKVVNFKDAFGVAIFSGVCRRLPAAATFLALAALHLVS